MFRYEINKQFCYVINNFDYITHTPSFPKGERCALLREGLTAYRLGSTHADYITDRYKRKQKTFARYALTTLKICVNLKGN